MVKKDNEVRKLGCREWTSALYILLMSFRSHFKIILHGMNAPSESFIDKVTIVVLYRCQRFAGLCDITYIVY